MKTALKIWLSTRIFYTAKYTANWPDTWPYKTLFCPKMVFFSVSFTITVSGLHIGTCNLDYLQMTPKTRLFGEKRRKEPTPEPSSSSATSRSTRQPSLGTLRHYYRHHCFCHVVSFAFHFSFLILVMSLGTMLRLSLGGEMKLWNSQLYLAFSLGMFKFLFKTRVLPNLE